MVEEKDEGIEVIVDDVADEGASESPEVKAQSESPSSEPQDKQASKDDLDNQSEAVRKRIDKLTFRLREAERREQAALDYARGLKQDADGFRAKADNLDKSLVQEFDNRIKVQETLAKDKLKSAIDMSDVDGQIEAQRMLADLAVQNERLRVERVRQQRAAAAPAAQPTYAPPAPEAKPDPKAQAWADRNQWFGTDEIMTLAAFNFHERLVKSEGYDPTSEDYYGELDRRLRTEFPHKFQTARRPSAPTVASARPSQSTAGKKQIRLTPSQVTIANRLGVSLESYAMEIQKLPGKGT
jgi:hypothetical protein